MALTIPQDKIADYIGHQCEPTHWHEVTQEQVNGFADNTLDHQFIHIDPEAAAKTPFGGTIAHGFLTLSMLSHFAETFGVEIEGAVMGINYGFDKVRFLSPVHVGKKIRAKAVIGDITEKKPKHYLTRYDVEVEIDSGETALVAQWFAMVVVG